MSICNISGRAKGIILKILGYIKNYEHAAMALINGLLN
jgi:hypothetical protein